MTTEAEIEKKTPDLYVFVKGQDGKNYRAGSVFLHGKGTGMNILIGQAVYSAFEPKPKAE